MRGVRRSGSICAPRLCAALAFVLVAGCGGRGTTLHTLRWPAQRARSEELLRFARRLFGQMVAGQPRDSDLSDDELSDVFQPEHAAQLRVMRRSGASPARVAASQYRRFRTTEFASACFQGATVTEAPGTLGLLASAATFDRVLIAGREADGSLWAAWVEGVFVLTDAGVRLVQAARYEPPRRDHADLELAPCDIRVPPGAGGP